MSCTYQNGYNDAIEDITNDMLDLCGTTYRDENDNVKVILNFIDILCIFKKYNLLAEDAMKDKLTESEKEKLDNTSICKKVL